MATPTDGFPKILPLLAKGTINVGALGLHAGLWGELMGAMQVGITPGDLLFKPC